MLSLWSKKLVDRQQICHFWITTISRHITPRQKLRVQLVVAALPGKLDVAVVIAVDFIVDFQCY